jgi:hypothetical protein
MVEIKIHIFFPERGQSKYTNFLKFLSQKMVSEKSFSQKSVCSNTFGGYCISAILIAIALNLLLA